MPMARGVIDVAVPTGTPQRFTSDAADWLAPHSRSVLQRLREHRKDGHAGYMRLFDELENARADAVRLEQRLREFRGEMYRLKDDDPASLIYVNRSRASALRSPGSPNGNASAAISSSRLSAWSSPRAPRRGCRWPAWLGFPAPWQQDVAGTQAAAAALGARSGYCRGD